ncbi:MAG: hypothetical protein AAF560_24290 [Acidobacteriota bacterium]
MSRLPNFFLGGAPKCGTTAIASYLAEHPQAFMSVPKEPFYFASDLPGMRKVQTEIEYRNLFRGAERRRVVGEASTLYLYSRTAFAELWQTCPESRIVIMLRPPAELIHAFHSQLLWGFHEDEPSFARAWELQADRAAGRSIPAGCRAEALLQYRELGRLGEQVERLLQVVPRSHVRFVLLEDLAAQPRLIYGQLLTFLGLDDDGRMEFPVRNRHRVYRSRTLGGLKHVLARRWPRTDRLLRTLIRLLKLEASARQAIGRESARPALPDSLRRQLEEELADDVRLLAELIQRRLDHWLPGSGSRPHRGAGP